jgi:hypothetical protein
MPVAAVTDTPTTPSNVSPLAPKFQTDAKSPFFMATEEWQKVQCFIEAGITLPISGAEAKVKLNVSAADVDHFSELWAAYKDVHDHCLDFQTNIFPNTVALAGAIVDYGRHRAPQYYGGITKVLNAIDAGTMTEEKGEKTIGLILTSLAGHAQHGADEAATAAKQIADFIATTQQDQSVLTPLKTRYEAELDGADGRIAQLRTEIKDDRDFIDTYNDEYRKDVTIATTTATYAWVFPAGTIAAGIVAGIYGQKAVEALKHVHEFQDKLEKDDVELAAKIALSDDIKICDTSVKGILDSLTAALPVLQKARGAWEALNTDIKAVLVTLKDDIQDAPSLIQQFGVDTALAEWADIATLADNYRANAFISVVSLADIEAKLALDPHAYDVPKAA